MQTFVAQAAVKLPLISTSLHEAATNLPLRINITIYPKHLVESLRKVSTHQHRYQEKKPIRSNRILPLPTSWYDRGVGHRQPPRCRGRKNPFEASWGPRTHNLITYLQVFNRPGIETRLYMRHNRLKRRSEREPPAHTQRSFFIPQSVLALLVKRRLRVPATPMCVLCSAHGCLLHFCWTRTATVWRASFTGRILALPVTVHHLFRIHGHATFSCHSC